MTALLMKIKPCTLIFASLLICYNSSAQDPFPAYAPVYKDDIIGRVDIIIPPDSLEIILAPGNEESEYHWHATFIYNNGTISDTFEDIGFQLRGNTSRYAKKKSFQISLNAYVPGRLWYGVEKINLNGEHNDPTVSRSKISWDLLRDIGIPAPRSNHVELYINDIYFGLYANVEHIDEEFVLTRFGNKDGNLYKCLWPADMQYLGDDPDLYKLTSGNRRVYELKTNEEKDDYSDLANLIDVLNKTPIEDLSCALEEIFNVNSLLKSIAFDILSGNWDGPLYNKNNFFLYHNLSTGLFEYIPYDLDNTFGIDWFGINWAERDIYTWGHPGEPRPLYWRILQVQEYKDRLSYYINKIIDESYKESVLFTRIDTLKALLAPFVEDDVYYTLDYGFGPEDFINGFSQSLPYGHTPIGIKPFIATRRSSAITQLDNPDITPIVNAFMINHPKIDEEITMRISVEDDQGVFLADALIQLLSTGEVTIHRMFDDGMHEDDEAGDGIYGLVLPPLGECDTLTYSIVVSDVNGNTSRYPCDLGYLPVCNSTLKLAVNEFMASNEATILDEFGENEDWVELYNYGTETIYLGDLFLTDKPDNPTKWQFPDTSIEAGEYLLIWADEDTDQGPLHADIKLSAGGEYIGIYDSDINANALIDGLNFGEQQDDESFGRLPNGTGPFKILVPTPGSRNEFILATETSSTGYYTLYPNPVKDVLFVKNSIGTSSQEEIVIFNLFGQIILTQSAQKSTAIDLSRFPAGIYILGVKSIQGINMMGKVVKE